MPGEIELCDYNDTDMLIDFGSPDKQSVVLDLGVDELEAGANADVLIDKEATLQCTLTIEQVDGDPMNVRMTEIEDEETGKEQELIETETVRELIPNEYHVADPENTGDMEVTFIKAARRNSTVERKWVAGDLVWAKFPGYPWWPAKVCLSNAD
jgi:PWWP domain